MKEERLKWYLDYKNWTLEDWKYIIWFNKTFVILLYRRERYCIWRKVNKRFLKSCIRKRWKGYSEFIF